MKSDINKKYSVVTTFGSFLIIDKSRCCDQPVGTLVHNDEVCETYITIVEHPRHFNGQRDHIWTVGIKVTEAIEE